MRQHLTELIDQLKVDSRHRLWDLPSRKYSPDIVQRWVTRYWSELERVHANGESEDYQWESDLHVIFLDLQGAIDKLPEQERTAILLITEEDLPLYRSIEEPVRCVAHRMHMSNKDLKILLRKAFRQISQMLES
jgi:DNA-directed RNA polymerase specialized sigma24 family protein